LSRSFLKQVTIFFNILENPGPNVAEACETDLEKRSRHSRIRRTRRYGKQLDFSLRYEAADS
jgi:hypothetical protein